MKGKFQKFLETKGIKPEEFTEKSAEEMAGLYNEFNEERQKEIEQLIETKASKEDIAEAVKELRESQLEQMKNLNEAVKQIGEKVIGLSEKGGNVNTEESSLVKFMKTIEERKEKGTGMQNTTFKAAALMTTANVLPNVADGFNQLFGNYVDPEIYSAPKPDNFILGLVDVAPAPGTENIWYVERINEEGDAEFIGEGDLKPLADGEYQEKKADIKEVAVRWKMSNRVMMHAPSVVSDFRVHADELVEQKIDDGVLLGDGTGNNLPGISTLASPFVVPTGLANYYENANIFDVIMAVATYVRLNNFKGDLTCVLNTVWQAKMFGVKAEDNSAMYVLPSFVAPDGTRVGEVTISFQNKAEEGKILLGDLRKYKVRVSEEARYYEGWENDDFSKNLSSRKIEAFLGSYLPANNAGAIIYDDIATVLTAIEVLP